MFTELFWIWVFGVAGVWCLARAFHYWSLNFLDQSQKTSLPQLRRDGHRADQWGKRAPGTRKSTRFILLLALLGGAFGGIAVFLWMQR